MRSGAPTPSQRIKSGVAVLISLAVVGAGVTIVGTKAYGWYQNYQEGHLEDYVGDGEEEIEIRVPNGAGWQRVGDILERNDVIADAGVFMDVYEDLVKELGDEKLAPQPQMGRFKVKTHWPAQTAFEYMIDPNNREVNQAQIPEGYRWADQVKPILVEASQLPKEEFDAAAADTAALGLPEYANGQIEGYLFPDTYDLPENAPDILARLTGRFKDIAQQVDLENKAADLGRSPRDLVVVASIIEAEVNQEQYRPMVARAIYNRLDMGIPLGVESAFRYGRLVTSGVPYGDPITVESQDDVALPYNYYKNPGL
ncbi:MAG: endolytic transglycosylase MltG, partial [Propionibacteriaceae bacterium]|nr:endolytic transglycosylase MltG [Propionibacteriaceae bacterium]